MVIGVRGNHNTVENCKYVIFHQYELNDKVKYGHIAAPKQTIVYPIYNINSQYNTYIFLGGRRSPAVACWASDHWVAGSNPLRGKFRH